MIHNIIQFLTDLIMQTISFSGYWGIFILMALESALIPIPSEVTMTFSGYLVSTGHFNFWLVVFIGAFANLVGSLLAYYLGFWGEDTFIRNLIKKYGKYLLISMDEYDKSEKWFRKYGQQIAFFSRVLPVVRTFISLPAGVSKMNIYKFSIYTFLGSFLWSLALTYVGFILGKNWNSLHVYYQKFEYLIVGLIFAAGIWYVWHKLRKVKK